MNKSFTILEVIIAIFVITIGVLAAYGVTQQIVSYTYRSASRLTATYLAMEGIEIVRNIRDTNWLQNNSTPGVPEEWDDGLTGGTGEWEADYTTTTFGNTNYDGCSDAGHHNCDNYTGDGDFLKLSGGFYCYAGTNDTNFKRKITITPDGTDKLKVSVEVQWKYKGDTYGPITVQEILYKWYPD